MPVSADSRGNWLAEQFAPAMRFWRCHRAGRRASARIVGFDGEKPEAFAPMSTTLTLEDEIDLSRGDILVSPDSPPRVSSHLEAMVVWLDAKPLALGHSYLIKHNVRSSRAKATKIRFRVNMHTLEREPAPELHMNDIAAVEFETASPLFFDPYKRNRVTGSFILIDPISNATVGAAMIERELAPQTEHVLPRCPGRQARGQAHNGAPNDRRSLPPPRALPRGYFCREPSRPGALFGKRALCARR